MFATPKASTHRHLAPRPLRPSRTSLQAPALAAGVIALSLAIGVTPSHASDRGFHLDLGFGAGHLDLSPRLERTLAEGGVSLDSDAPSGEFRVGYAFSREFQLDAVFTGYDLDTGDRDLHAGYGEARLEVVSHFAEWGNAHPYLAGAVGGAVLGVGRDEDDLEEIEGSVASVGGGLEVDLSRHWALGFDYRYGVANFEDDDVDLPLARVDLDGAARSHTWGLRFQFGF